MEVNIPLCKYGSRLFWEAALFFLKKGLGLWRSSFAGVVVILSNLFSFKLT